MQVTHAADHIKAAVIGGNQAIEYTISDSAEFFQILSSTLYKDQILAVARETLCNAWDIHIATNREHIAVEIWIDRTKLVIRDYGTGIHDDDMATVYCQYGGGSTKRNDGRQTGGFSLGCKAPFAYAEHFEVQSMHKGTKTIYALAKSSAERNGKPSMQKIVSMPTTEEGLQVSMNIEAKDYERFKQVLERIAHNGSMNVKMGNPGSTLRTIECLPFKVGSNFLITNAQVLDNHTRIAVRYGNVIYPVDRHPKFDNAYDRISKFLQVIENHRDHYTLILQAPPDSISVQPSREGLSMQEHTMNTLVSLVHGWMDNMQKPLNEATWELLDKRIEAVKKEGLIGDLLSQEHRVPGERKDQWGGYRNRQNKPHLASISDMAAQQFVIGYPKLDGFRKKDLEKRFAALAELKWGFPGTMNDFYRMLMEGPSKSEIRKAGKRTFERRPRWAYNWYKRNILKRIVTGLNETPGLSHKKLWMFTKRASERQSYLMRPEMYAHDSFEFYMPMLRNIVVITHAKSDLDMRTRQAPLFKKMGDNEEFFVYLTPPAATKILPTVREFFKNKGYQVLDLTEYDETWMTAKPVIDRSLMPPVVKAKPVPRAKGLPLLAECKPYMVKKESGTEYEQPWRIDNVIRADSRRTTTPEMYHFFNPSKGDSRDFSLCGFDRTSAKHIVNLFGERCAMIYTDAQLRKMKESTLPTLETFVFKHVLTQVTTAPQFLEYWKDSVERIVGSDTAYAIKLFDIPEVRIAMGLNNPLSKDDLLVLFLWREMCNNYRFGDGYNAPLLSERKAGIALIEAIPKSQVVQDMAPKFRDNKLLMLMDFHEIWNILKAEDGTTPSRAPAIAEMIKIALG